MGMQLSETCFASSFLRHHVLLHVGRVQEDRMWRRSKKIVFRCNLLQCLTCGLYSFIREGGKAVCDMCIA